MNTSSILGGWGRLKDFLRAGLNSSVRERRRILWLLPLLVALCLLFLWQGKPRFERSFTLYSDAVLENRRTDRDPARDKRLNPEEEKEPVMAGSAGESTDSLSAKKFSARREYSLSPFDPNTITLEGLVSLGFSPKQAQVILNYRQAGAVFRRPEDFARCYTVSARKFAELKPYIRIGESYRIPEEKPERVVPGPEVSTPDRGPDSPETEAAVSEDRTGGSGSRVLGSETPVPDGPVELNGADSATLVALRGIGPLTAGRIVQYRDRLGGFVQIEQVLEVQGVREENYRMFSTQIFVDSSKIQKIDINFATPEQLAGHPYLPPRVLDRILKHRQLKGGWSHTGELVEQHILSREQAAKLAPYLHFGPR